MSQLFSSIDNIGAGEEIICGKYYYLGEGQRLFMGEGQRLFMGEEQRLFMEGKVMLQYESH